MSTSAHLTELSISELRLKIEKQKKSKSLTFIFWLFFGYIGGHRFYLGDIRNGILMFISLGGFFIWTFIDFFKIKTLVNTKNNSILEERILIQTILENKLHKQKISEQQEKDKIRSIERNERARLNRLEYEEKEKERKLAILRSGIHTVDNLPGLAFESYLKDLFIQQGYRVQVTTATGDYGADLILFSKNNSKIIVQAKRYKGKVGLQSVQEVYTAKNHYKADECWVVTNQKGQRRRYSKVC